MPTQTFFNLSEEKRNRLLHASIQEFSDYSFNDASINRIVKCADIPRGSFYQYFEDKEDLYFYLARKIKNKSEQVLRAEIIKANGDLFEGVRHYFPQFLTLLMDHPHTNFFKQLFLHMDYRASKEITPEELKKHHEQRDSKNGILASVNQSILEVDSPEELHQLFHLIIFIMVQEVTEGFARQYPQEKISTNFRQKLRWIESGARKKND